MRFSDRISAGLLGVQWQPSSLQIVHGMMRLRCLLLVGLSAAAAASACSRPVLYYPETYPAAKPAPRAVVPLADSAPTLAGAPAGADVDYLAARRLMIPVAGADPAKLEDSFREPRDGDRVHRAIDILAPRGTPILSADDGKILRMTTSTLGGISMYTVDPSSRLVYYYAHMERYNGGMSPGRTIAKGDTLGFVGTTGNAPKDIPHLHFQIMRWPADGKYWNGEPIDPFEVLGGRKR
jgi:murein DD-endopeptidase MepM/ murein hydrolase activator NlpD